MYVNKVMMTRKFYGSSDVYEVNLYVFTPDNVLLVHLMDLQKEKRVGITEVKVLTPKSMENFDKEVKRFLAKRIVTILDAFDFETLCPQYKSAVDSITVEGNHATWEETLTPKDYEFDDDCPF